MDTKQIQAMEVGVGDFVPDLPERIKEIMCASPQDTDEESALKSRPMLSNKGN